MKCCSRNWFFFEQAYQFVACNNVGSSLVFGAILETKFTTEKNQWTHPHPIRNGCKQQTDVYFILAEMETYCFSLRFVVKTCRSRGKGCPLEPEMKYENGSGMAIFLRSPKVHISPLLIENQIPKWSLRTSSIIQISSWFEALFPWWEWKIHSFSDH